MEARYLDENQDYVIVFIELVLCLTTMPCDYALHACWCVAAMVLAATQRGHIIPIGQ